MDLLLKDEVYAIVGAAMDVYNELGAGFLEAVYQEAMELELTGREIPFCSQRRLVIFYKGRPLKKEYVADLVCDENLLVEIKATEGLISKDESQLINYLHATHLRVGVLINFGHPRNFEWKRMVV